MYLESGELPMGDIKSNSKDDDPRNEVVYHLTKGMHNDDYFAFIHL